MASQKTNAREIKLALSIVWLLISTAILMVLCTPFFFSEDSLVSLLPKCEWKEKYNKECPLCGMTTSFILISQGKFSEALSANNFSLYLYCIFVLNEITILIFLTDKKMFELRRRS